MLRRMSFRENESEHVLGGREHKSRQINSKPSYQVEATRSYVNINNVRNVRRALSVFPNYRYRRD